MLMHVSIAPTEPSIHRRLGPAYPAVDDEVGETEHDIADMGNEASETLEKRLNIYPNTYHSTDEVDDGECYPLRSQSSMLTMCRCLRRCCLVMPDVSGVLPEVDWLLHRSLVLPY